MSGRIEHDDLAHLCRLASVAVSAVRSPDWAEWIKEAPLSEVRQAHTCLQILADAFVELQRRHSNLPVFRVPAVRRAPE